MVPIFGTLFPRRLAERQAAAEAYRRLLHHALQPRLYLDFAVPDTFEGRAGAVTLLSSLAFARLGRIGSAEASRMVRHLDGLILDGFDAAYREKGVGDHSIARKVRKLAQGHAGMGKALFAALTGPEDSGAAVAAVLERNGLVPEDGARKLAGAARHMLDRLDGQPDAEILAGAFDWVLPPP